MDLTAKTAGMMLDLRNLREKVRGLLEKRVWRALLTLTVLTAVPFGSWLMGSGMANIAPHSYRSSAVVHLPSHLDKSAVEQEKQRMRSTEVVDRAARSLAGPAGVRQADPMDAYLLWSSLEAEGVEGENFVRLAVSGPDEAATQRKLEAIVSAYQSVAITAAALSGEARDATYVMPIQSGPVRVTDEVRIVLGLAAFAGVALTLSIPLLKQMERMTPRLATV